ncbi:hydrolase, NUDIX family protein [Ketogulonicigenium robustum]|uniref:Hydrolase, NUDIX family protein n=1 Tax=Ketogulonicigenium robustum TaxID=92947 RepID=A0A1W6P0U4_9RHOB|nr:NUDIX hydrolase [Ketogulonicigenium robustum]ARO15136.1 hydrolase, NUDIX family protein [Ketogulonicigenium robustum]
MSVQIPPRKGRIAQRKSQLERTLSTGKLGKSPLGGMVGHADPLYHQVGALCWRKTPKGREVLLVAASSGRWIIPKGWAMPGKSHAAAALTEAWEEAGVKKAKAKNKPIGHYMAIKRTLGGDDVPGIVYVFAAKVRKMSDTYPEATKRARQWLPPARAAALVDEDGLRALLLAFDGTPDAAL